ncbi:folate receptor beta [Bufo bufo]|uniref:folate receptor beta n=1 Tax=Bufo bufo TaxID=8384 RepID=UPI001ABE07D7|nr:folate receptor beta [Bufo bufo]XP_040278598.1 folate receptor beta [Bufo bufo]
MLRCVILLITASLLSAAKESLMDICIDGKHHKTEPGPEDNLHGKCTPWKQKACCSVNTSEAAHQDLSYLYNFNWDHCGVMSEDCKQHFIHDTCFYECSPNLGPWIVQVDQSWRNERIQDVPLCKEDCEGWYNACANDYTCMDNWHVGWDWSTGVNRCPVGKSCQKLRDVFTSAKDFCEKVWSKSYAFTEYVRGSGRCMQITFENDNVEPNVKVAQYYADLKGSAPKTRLGLFIFLAPFFTLWAL